jgi:hypothetical protein
VTIHDCRAEEGLAGVTIHDVSKMISL